MPFLYPIHDAPHDSQRLTHHGLARDVEAASLRIETVSPRLGSAESTGLIVSLCLAGMSMEAVRSRHPSILSMPLLLAAIPVVNRLAGLGARFLPSWDGITNGYQLIASKP